MVILMATLWSDPSALPMFRFRLTPMKTSPVSRIPESIPRPVSGRISGDLNGDLPPKYLGIMSCPKMGRSIIRFFLVLLKFSFLKKDKSAISNRNQVGRRFKPIVNCNIDIYFAAPFNNNPPSLKKRVKVPSPAEI